MSKIMEHGGASSARAREREPPPQNSESKLKNTTANFVVSESLRATSKRSADLQQPQSKETPVNKRTSKAEQKAEFSSENAKNTTKETRHGAGNPQETITPQTPRLIHKTHETRETKTEAPPPVRESKLQNTVANFALSASVFSAVRGSTNLSQFTNKNIKRQRRNDKISERQEARTDRKMFTEESKVSKLTDEKQSLSKELHALIKKEYGSVENYAMAKRELGFRKSTEHSALSVKITEVDGKLMQTGKRYQQHSARRNSLLEQRSQSLYFRAGKGNRCITYSPKSTDRLERKVAKAERKLDKANLQRNLPQHHIFRKSYQFNPETGKIKKNIILSREVKPIDGRGGIVAKGLKGLSAVTAVRLSASIHGQLTKHGSGTDSEKAFNTGVRAIEHGAVKVTKHAHKFLTERPYKKVSKLQLKSDRANAKLYAKRKGGSTRQMKKHAKEYMNRAKEARRAKSRIEKIGEAFKAIGVGLKKC
ncbi:MAG: hypothetical protein LBC82_05835 [Oscillospiraceae bacterium]|jgi:hypothetical protein|nr:hypothetical protein [Oscillospiraceae bacterium]